MKNRNLMGLCFALIFGISSCAEFDHEGKEFYKQEVYIINSESTSATEREISGIDAYTFIDTLRIIDDSYNSDTIYRTSSGSVSVIFKVGLGGSLAAEADINVLVKFNDEATDDYNILNNTSMRIPPALTYVTNVAYDEALQAFPVVIKKGESSSQLRFDIPIHRDSANNMVYADYIFPLEITDVGSAILSRQYSEFVVARLDVYKSFTVDWSGRPIPTIPTGRYHSTQLEGNGGENTIEGAHRMYKYITPLSGVGNEDENLKDQYMIWGHGIWSWEKFGLHGNGWMYGQLSLNDQVGGTYTLNPLKQDDVNSGAFPAKTWDYASDPRRTVTNKYDPKLKVLTLYYENIMGSDYSDVLTFVDESLDWKIVTTAGVISPQSWEQVRNKGYKYWLPIDVPEEEAP